MRKKIGLLSWFLGVCCIIVGCVSPTSWIGVSEDAVITRFGLPEKSYTTNDRKYLVYDFTGIDYAFDKSKIPVVSNTQTKETGNCTGTFVIDDGIVEKLTIQGTNCQLYQIQN